MIEGGCNCGAVRYAIDGEPLAVAACHCTRCRRQSGSAFSVNLVVMASTMTVTVTGDLAVFEDTETSSGASVMRQFCRVCGSPIRSLLAANPAITAVKAGTVDEPDGFAPTLHVWTQSKLAWVEVPAGMPQFAQNPG